MGEPAVLIDELTPEEQAEADEIVYMIYEDALVDEEPWALEAFEYRQLHGPP